jgi:branched-chain amino acid transport system permease protein
MWGAYLTWLFLSLGLSYFAVIPLVIAITFLFGVVLQVTAIRPLLLKEGWQVTTIISTMAVSILLQNGALVIFGPTWKTVPPVISGTLQQFSFPISVNRLLILGLAVLITLALSLFLRKAKLGMAIRAIEQDRIAAKLVGINDRSIHVYTLGVASALAGLAGLLSGSIFIIMPSMGFEPLLRAFIVIIIGGLGSVKGTFCAAYVVGILESLSGLFLGVFWAEPIIFMFLIIMLVLRPRGFFGEIR